MTKAMNDLYLSWEGEVLDCISEALESSYSDAQGFLGAHNFVAQQCWSKGLPPKESAERIIAAGTAE